MKGIFQFCTFLTDRAITNTRQINREIGTEILRALDLNYFDTTQSKDWNLSTKDQQNFIQGIRHYISAIQVYEAALASDSILDKAFHTNLVVQGRVLTDNMSSTYGLIKNLIL
jgi:hypothetical protein